MKPVTLKSKGPKVRPSKRMKKRYIKLSIECPRAIEKREFERAFARHVFSLYGPRGLKEVSPAVIELHRSGTGILRCSRPGLEKAERALQCLGKVEGTRVKVRILAESGTLKSLR